MKIEVITRIEAAMILSPFRWCGSGVVDLYVSRVIPHSMLIVKVEDFENTLIRALLRENVLVRGSNTVVGFLFRNIVPPFSV